MSAASHSGKCQHCHLCSKQNAKIKHLLQLKMQPQFKEAWLGEHKPDLDTMVCLCLPCVKQIQQNHDKEFTPRWLPKPVVPPKLCNVQQCQGTVYARTSLMSAAALETCFKAKVNDVSTVVGLCREHYTKMYKMLSSPPCESCQVKPKKRETFNRHCSSPDIVNQYLSQMSQETSTLTISSNICLSCNKYFQSIIAEVTGKGRPLVATESLTTRLSMEIETIRAKGESIECSEFYDMVFCKTGRYLCSKMKANEAILLSTLYHSFLTDLQSEASNYKLLDPLSANKIPQNRWMLSRLHHHFGDILCVACRHFSYGTVLYHKDCDLLNTVSAALGRNKELCREASKQKSTISVPKVKDTIPTTSSTGTACTCNCGIDAQIENTATYLNNKVHEVAKTLITRYQDVPKEYTMFSISSYKQLIDPALLLFIEKLTQSVRSRRRKLFQSEADLAYTKQLRQLYIISLVLFCTNTQCSMPFHSLLTEATLCHGGTQELVKILNRVGAIASIDTHQRLATQVVEERISQGVISHINKEALSIVSVDNIDILQPHAFVSCMDATRSWHEISVQCMQPLPITGLLEAEDKNEPQMYTPHKHLASSPTESPVPVEKSKHRRRTLTESHSPHTTLSVRHRNTFDMITSSNSFATPAPQLVDFRQSQSEIESMKLLQEDIFKCMLLKCSGPQKHNLPGLQSLLNCVCKQSSNTEVSAISYIEITS